MQGEHLNLNVWIPNFVIEMFVYIFCCHNLLTAELSEYSWRFK